MYNNVNVRKVTPNVPQHPSHATANEMQAKEKLVHYVYEYLVHNNATKTAEVFKAELMPSMPNASITVGEAPGFLTQWFSLFWDLYSGDPERREKCNPSQESKAFHDYGFVNPNGMRPPFGPGIMPPGGPGGIPPEMSPYFRANMQGPPGGFAPRPPGAQFMPPGGPHAMMPPSTNPMRPPAALADPRMRMPPSSMSFPMRPPNRYAPPPFMESPSGNPPGFPMPAPSQPPPMPPPPQPHELGHDGRYGPMITPTSTGMPPQFLSDSSMPPPSSMAPSTSVSNTNGQMPNREVPTTGVGSSLAPLQVSSQLSSLINGDDHKQSPHHPIGAAGGPNNGTPGPMGPGSHHGTIMGPGSAAPGPPTSVHTPGQPSSVANPVTSQQPSQMQMPPPGPPPQSNMMDHDMMDFASNNPSRPEMFQDMNEIKKIREGLLDDFDQA